MDAALTQQAKTNQPFRNFRQEALKARSAYIGEIISGGVPAARRAIKLLGCFAVAAAAFWGTTSTPPAATIGRTGERSTCGRNLMDPFRNGRSLEQPRCFSHSFGVTDRSADGFGRLRGSKAARDAKNKSNLLPARSPDWRANVQRPAGAKQESVGPERACAAYDLHWITLIEDHGRAQEMEGEEIYRAFLTILEARLACRVGNFDRALNSTATFRSQYPG